MRPSLPEIQRLQDELNHTNTLRYNRSGGTSSGSSNRTQIYIIEAIVSPRAMGFRAREARSRLLVIVAKRATFR